MYFNASISIRFFNCCSISRSVEYVEGDFHRFIESHFTAQFNQFIRFGCWFGFVETFRLPVIDRTRSFLHTIIFAANIKQTHTIFDYLIYISDGFCVYNEFDERKKLLIARFWVSSDAFNLIFTLRTIFLVIAYKLWRNTAYILAS